MYIFILDFVVSSTVVYDIPNTTMKGISYCIKLLLLTENRSKKLFFKF